MTGGSAAHLAFAGASAAAGSRPLARDRGWAWRAGAVSLRSWRTVFGGVFLLLVVVVGIFAPWIAPHSYAEQDRAQTLRPPVLFGGSTTHVLGTDSLGRDVLSRLVYGAQASLLVAAASVALALSLGLVVGLVAGFYEGAVEAVTMRLADIQLAFPYLLLAIAVLSLAGPNLVNLIIVVALRGWVSIARTVRGSVLSAKQDEYVMAARALGAGDRHILLRHLLPNVATPVIVVGTFQLAASVLTEASLSFLGLGVQPPAPSWGGMLNDGRLYFFTAWWLTVEPGLAISLLVLSVNFVGDGLRDALDPRLTA